MLSAELASVFARVALANVQREYPRRLDQLRVAAEDEWRPRALHPAFYGSYDWQSAVHMHWLLARLLRLFPAMDAEIAPVLEAHLSNRRMAQELAFFNAPGGTTFERPYGWAWLLQLQAELLRLDRWHREVAPLAGELAARLIHYVSRSAYPVRAGTHGNTAFACVLALEYAHTAQDRILGEAIREAARRWYAADQGYPVAYEPSGDDFLSAGLTEALLMKSVLAPTEFAAWFKGFLPADLGPLARPPRVLDHADAKHSHLDGLCLSRAWCFRQLGFDHLAQRHLAAGMPYVAGGDYAGEHWLASFALLALSAEAPSAP